MPSSDYVIFICKEKTLKLNKGTRSYLSLFLFLDLSIYLSIYLSLQIYLSTYLIIYLSIYLCIQFLVDQILSHLFYFSEATTITIPYDSKTVTSTFSTISSSTKPFQTTPQVNFGSFNAASFGGGIGAGLGISLLVLLLIRCCCSSSERNGYEHHIWKILWSNHMTLFAFRIFIC